MPTKSELANALANAAVKLAERAENETEIGRANAAAEAALRLTQAAATVGIPYLDS